MGTRNLTCVVLGGEYKVAQYGKWDGNPEGQGATILDFLRTMNRKRFEAQLRDCIFCDRYDILRLLADAGHDGGDIVEMSVSNKFNDANPQLNCDIGGHILTFIQAHTGVIELENHVDFALNSLSCEYAYVVDLDNDVFEVYEGFNECPSKPGARFQGGVDDSGYGPVALVKSFSLYDLPNEKTFIAAFKDAEELAGELEENTRALLNTLCGGDLDAEIANHIANYIEANMDDFIESVCPEE